MGNTYSGSGAAGSNCFNLVAGAGTIAGATSVAGSPCITLVAGSNITLTGTAPNQITIASSGGGGGGMTSWTLSGDSGANQTITDGNTVDIAGGTGLSSVASATDTVTMNLDNTAVAVGSYTYASLTVDQQGRLTAASSGAAPGTMSSFKLGGDTGSAETVVDGNTLTVAGGTGLSSVVSSTDTVTMNLDDTAVTPATYGDASNVAQITIDQQGRITAAVDVAISGGGGGVTLSGSTPETISTVTGANALQGEANLTFDGSTLAVTGDLTTSTSVSATTSVSANTTVSAGTVTRVGTGILRPSIFTGTPGVAPVTFASIIDTTTPTTTEATMPSVITFDAPSNDPSIPSLFIDAATLLILSSGWPGYIFTVVSWFIPQIGDPTTIFFEDGQGPGQSISGWKINDPGDSVTFMVIPPVDFGGGPVGQLMCIADSGRNTTQV